MVQHDIDIVIQISLSIAVIVFFTHSSVELQVVIMPHGASSDYGLSAFQAIFRSKLPPTHMADKIRSRLCVVASKTVSD